MRREFAILLIMLSSCLLIQSASAAADTQIMTYEDVNRTRQNLFFRPGSTVYFRSLGTGGATEPLMYVRVGGVQIQVIMEEVIPGSGIYRGSFLTDRFQTDDQRDMIRTRNGALVELRSDIDGDGIEGTTDVLNITIDDQEPNRPRRCEVNATERGAVRVNWTRYDGKDFRRYTVVRANTANFSDVLDVANISNQDLIQWYDPESNLIDGVKYWYGVKVIDHAGNPSLVRKAENFAVPVNDTIAPSPVAGLTGWAPEEGNSINLTWQRNPEPDVVGYNIYHSREPEFGAADENLIGFVRDPVFLHQDISANYLHFYLVVAFDENENPSEPSPVFNATPDDTIPPLAPVFPSVTTDETGYLNLTWLIPSGEEVFRYTIYRSTESGAQEFWNPYKTVREPPFIDKNVEKGVTYYYVVRASDAAGNQENNTIEVSAMSQDTTPPSPPRALKAEDTDMGGRIKLTWLPPGGETPAEYRIFKSNISEGHNFSRPLAVVSGTSFTDREVEDGVPYYYVVRSVDSAGNVEENTEEIRVVSRDETPPPHVTMVIAVPRKGGKIGISWMPPGSNVEDPDIAKQMREDVDHYHVYWNTYEGFKPDPARMITTTETFAQHTDLIDGQAYYYVVRSVDAVGNENMEDEKTSASAVADTSPPGSPLDLRTIRLRDGRIKLDWRAPSGEAPYRYNIYRSSVPDAQEFDFPFAMVSNTEWVDDNVTDGQQYYYVVRSADFLLNEDTNTLEVSNISEDLTPPAAPRGLIVTKLSKGDLMLNWTVPPVETGSTRGRPADKAVLYRIYSATSSGAQDFDRPIAETPNPYFVDKGLRNGITYHYVVRSVDSAGNEDHNQFEANGTADAQPPSPPLDLKARRSTTGEVILTWDDPAGERVHEYRLYKFRGDEKQDFSEPLIVTRKNAFVDNDVSEAIKYRYVIRSVDKADNEGQNTNEIVAPVLLGPPRNLQADPGEDGVIEVSWDPPQDGSGSVQKYHVYRATRPGLKQTEPWTTTISTQFIDAKRVIGGVAHEMINGKRYYYYVRAVDLYGNEGIKSEEVSAVSDSEPPSKPRKLDALPQPTGDIELRWATPIGEQVEVYRIYRSTSSGSYNFYSPIAETSRIIYYDENLESGTRYYYVVRSVDEAGNEEENRDEIYVTALDKPPSAPRNLKAQLRPNGSIVLTWTPPQGEPISHYNIYRSRSPLSQNYNQPYAQSAIAIFNDNFVEHDETYYYVVRAVDSTGNEEENEIETSIRSVDTEPPGAPVALSAEGSGTGSIRLEWRAPSGENPAKYFVYRSNSPYFTPGNQNYLNQTYETQFTDRGLGPSQTYYYIVHSADSVGNEDDNDNRVQATTPPPHPTGLEATPKDNGDILLTWNVSSAPADSFRVYRRTEDSDFSLPLAQIPYPTNSFQDSELNHSQEYIYVVRSVGPNGQEESNMIEVSAVSMEKIPPLPPQDLETDQLANGNIRLHWSHPQSSDVSVYRVYKSSSGAGIAGAEMIAETNLTVFEDSNVTSGDNYYYLVRAVDRHDNEEDNDNWKSVMSLDTLPPSPPTNLSAKSLPGGEIELRWRSPPERDVRFKVYRSSSNTTENLSLVTTTNETSYIDSDLENGKEYYYWVRSEDLAGNEELNTNTVSAVASKSGPRILLALSVIILFVVAGYVLDSRRRLAEKSGS